MKKFVFILHCALALSCLGLMGCDDDDPLIGCDRIADPECNGGGMGSPPPVDPGPGDPGPGDPGPGDPGPGDPGPGDPGPGDPGPGDPGPGDPGPGDPPTPTVCDTDRSCLCEELDPLSLWPYLLTSSTAGGRNELKRFIPTEMRFQDVGVVNCPTSATPFSMSVDSAGVVWALFDDGNIWNLSTEDASCTASGYAPGQMGITRFGMAFTADEPGSRAETLYVTGGGSPADGGNASLAAINPMTKLLSRVGSVPGWPELSGTGNGALIGFFPERNPFIMVIDKTSGAEDSRVPLAGLDFSNPRAWAFVTFYDAQYMFIATQSDVQSRGLTQVYRYREGVVDHFMRDTGIFVVGAGAAPCWPGSVPGTGDPDDPGPGGDPMGTPVPPMEPPPPPPLE